MSTPACPIFVHARIHAARNTDALGFVNEGDSNCVGSRCALWNSQPGVTDHGRCGIGHGNNFRDPAAPELPVDRAKEVLVGLANAFAEDRVADVARREGRSRYVADQLAEDLDAEPTVDVVDDEPALSDDHPEPEGGLTPGDTVDLFGLGDNVATVTTVANEFGVSTVWLDVASKTDPSGAIVPRTIPRSEIYWSHRTGRWTEVVPF